MRLTLLFCLTFLAQAQNPAPSLEAQVIVPPKPFPSQGQLHLAYELHLKNLEPDGKSVTINRVEALDGDTGKVLIDLGDKDLVSHLKLPGVKGNARQLASGGRMLVFLWLDVPSDRRPPSSLRHRVTASKDARSETVQGDLVPVVSDSPPVLAPPFRDGDWLAANAPSSAFADHGRASITINGRDRIAQRFAIDWLRIGNNGAISSGKGKDNRNFYGYGVEVLAVADGNVTAVKDGIPENQPEKLAVPITFDTVAGNFISIDVGHGRYVHYGHLQPGSLRVKTGDAVKTGQVLGLLGNSGNSDAPHLHFQVTDGPSFLDSEGVPYVINSYEQRGRAPKFKLLPDPEHKKVLGELPLDGVVVRFQ